MKFKTIPVAALAMAVALPLTTHAAELKSHQQKFSYAVGFRLAQSLKAEGLQVDPGAFSQAMKDSLSDAEPAMSVEDMQAALQAERDIQLKKLEETAAKNKAAGDKFRAENAGKAGVKTTDSGIQYRAIKSGDGTKAGKESTVTVNYRGKLIDGTEFDSSYKRNQPATFGLAGVIKGWQEIVPMMKVGDKWEVVIPPELAYMDKGAGDVIGPNETLVFEIELLDVK
jgi:FKBP-type peptidyl-prolyl cis-trans isomerase FklB